MDSVINLANTQLEAMHKACQKIGHYVKVNKNIKEGKQNNARSNIQCTNLTRKKKITYAHLVADDSEILEITSKEDIPQIDSICVQPTNTTT